MGYSVHEWFEDQLVPILKKVIDQSERNKDSLDEEDISSYDAFISGLRRVLQSREDRRFVSVVLDILLNSNEEKYDLDDYIKEFFYRHTQENDITLSKVEYRKNAATTVVVNYNDFQEGG